MIQEKLSQLIEDTVREAISNNKDFIFKSILFGISPSDRLEDCTSKMAINAVETATRLSIQIFLTLILENGTLKFSEDSLVPQLTAIQGGADSESNDAKYPQ